MYGAPHNGNNNHNVYVNNVAAAKLSPHALMCVEFIMYLSDQVGILHQHITTEQHMHDVCRQLSALRRWCRHVSTAHYQLIYHLRNYLRPSRFGPCTQISGMTLKLPRQLVLRQPTLKVSCHAHNHQASTSSAALLAGEAEALGCEPVAVRSMPWRYLAACCDHGISLHVLMAPSSMSCSVAPYVPGTLIQYV